MNTRVEAGQLSGDVFRDPTGAHHSSAKTAILGARCAAIITIVLALLTGCGSGSGAPAVSTSSGSGSGAPPPSTFCGSGSGVPTVAFHPDLFLPIEISLAVDGSIEVSFSPELATPVGTFSFGMPVACGSIAPHGTLLVISRLVRNVIGLGAQHGREAGSEELVRHDVGGRGEVAPGEAGDMEEVTIIKINETVKMTFLVDGPATLTMQGNIATLSLGSRVTGIRIQESQSGQADRFSISQVSAPLPTPSEMTSPPAPPPSSWPVPKVSCKTVGGGGAVNCWTTPIRGTGSYQWFDNGTLIGSVNPLNTTLAVGDHFITATVIISNDSFVTAFTSYAHKVPVPGGQASATASAS